MLEFSFHVLQPTTFLSSVKAFGVGRGGGGFQAAERPEDLGPVSPGANVMGKGRSQGLTWTEATCWLGTTSSGMITTNVDKKGSVEPGPCPPA